MKLSRLRRPILITGATLCVLIAGAFVVWAFQLSALAYVHFPLYAPFLAVAVPTLLVWRFWPKPVKPGHCGCGYDLRGNESGRCPECGIEVQV